MQDVPHRRHNRMKSSAPWLAMLFSLCVAAQVQAQDAPPEAESPAETAAADATQAQPAPESQETAAEEPASASPAPLPIMVVVVPARRVSEEATLAAGAAVTAQVTPLAGGRPVHALGDETILTAMRACSDDLCLGAQLASAPSQAGVVVRLQRTRAGYSASLELRDPVSGALRGELVEGELPREVEGFAAALAPLSAQLEPQMPSPPPPPSTLLVTVNVDGAMVQLDGQELGESPVSSVEVSVGAHTVSVMAAGHVPVQRRTEVGLGEQARLDVTLNELGSEVAGESGGTVGEGAWATGPEDDGELTEQWWFWAIVGGGAAVVLGVAIGIGVALSDQGPEMVDPQGIELPPLMGGL